MSDSLETLLTRLKDGGASPADLVRARALVSEDARIPEELRSVVFVEIDDIEADAAALLAVLGLDDLGSLIADAVRAEAEAADVSVDGGVDDEGWTAIAAVLREGLEAEAVGFDIADAVVRRLPAADFAHGTLVASAVTAEAGPVDLSDEVAADLSLVVLPVAEAVRAEAGTIELADAVVAELGLERVPVAEAVRAEAGEVDVVGAVMAELGLWRVTAAPAAAVVPVPANERRAPRFGIAGLALAAAALLSVVVGRLSNPVESERQLVFASASEVQIEDLQVGANVQVMQMEGDGGAVILWLDEEA